MSDYQAVWNLSYEIRQLKKEVARLRITKAEREAIGRAAVYYERQYDDYRDVTDGDTAKTLRAFLCRAK